MKTRMGGTERKTGEEILEKTRPKTQKPTLYKVILHNDDYTTMQFVIEILEVVFHHAPADAFRIMMQVHREGQAVCGSYGYEIAETKVAEVHELARENGFPLRASMEEA
jgi:ATP-dependent Clp protease adaptor protein ClpS